MTSYEHEPGILYLRRQGDGLHAIEGELAPGTKYVNIQWRNFGGQWGPPLGTRAALLVGRMREMMASGPHAHDEYRHIPVRDVPGTPEEAAQKATRLEQLKRLPGKPAKESELVTLIRARQIVPPLVIFGEYRKQKLTATIDSNGNVIYGESSFKSLSAAGAAAISAIKGKPASIDGWTFWQQEAEDGKLKALPRANKIKGD